jgi:hypothetical protein
LAKARREEMVDSEAEGSFSMPAEPWMSLPRLLIASARTSGFKSSVTLDKNAALLDGISGEARSIACSAEFPRIAAPSFLR